MADEPLGDLSKDKVVLFLVCLEIVDGEILDALDLASNLDLSVQRIYGESTLSVETGQVRVSPAGNQFNTLLLCP